MEETNYDRPARLENHETPVISEAQRTESATGSEEESKVANATEKQGDSTTNPVDSETGQVIYPRKTFVQKMGIKDKPRPNRMLDIALGALRGFTYPSVVYAG